MDLYNNYKTVEQPYSLYPGSGSDLILIPPWTESNLYQGQNIYRLFGCYQMHFAKSCNCINYGHYSFVCSVTFNLNAALDRVKSLSKAKYLSFIWFLSDAFWVKLQLYKLCPLTAQCKLFQDTSRTMRDIWKVIYLFLVQWKHKLKYNVNPYSTFHPFFVWTFCRKYS